ncbi:MAG: transporter substrate-binding domain-containing protein [Candidatus Delongbacteria bacterium]|nr:transporter substrate-binding domain-containing protein [Candidatus Delongbacteria bacterium]MBN2834188.1 transporter substrate-binding domain-containing protein [Candidatus Delongbacteria bacterium]
MKIVIMIMIATFFFSNAEVYKIGTYKIPKLVDSETEGVFVKIWIEAAKRANVDYELVFSATKRTLQNYAEGQLVGYFPSLLVTIPKDSEMSEEFFYKYTYAFTKKGSPKINSISDLKGKKVGLTSGYAFSEELTNNPDIITDYAATNEQNFKKLSIGRVDVVVSDDKSGPKAIEDAGLTDIEFDKDKPLEIQKVFFAFEKSDKGRLLNQKISEALKEMKKDGTYDKILEELKVK